MKLIIYIDDTIDSIDIYDVYKNHKASIRIINKEQKIFPDDTFKNKKVKKKYILDFEEKLDKLLKNKNREFFI